MDAALSNLENIILKYFPDEYSLEERRNILIDLSLLEADLSKHKLLEDKILISLVEQIEKAN